MSNDVTLAFENVIKQISEKRLYMPDFSRLTRMKVGFSKTEQKEIVELHQVYSQFDANQKDADCSVVELTYKKAVKEKLSELIYEKISDRRSKIEILADLLMLRQKFVHIEVHNSVPSFPHLCRNFNITVRKEIMREMKPFLTNSFELKISKPVLSEFYYIFSAWYKEFDAIIPLVLKMSADEAKVLYEVFNQLTKYHKQSIADLEECINTNVHTANLYQKTLEIYDILMNS